MTYKPSQWNAICDRCGFEFKSSELREDWQGLMVCKKDYETRHPQDFIRIRPEKPAADWARPENTDTFIDPIACTLEGQQGVSGIGVSGCSITNYSTPYA